MCVWYLNISNEQSLGAYMSVFLAELTQISELIN